MVPGKPLTARQRARIARSVRDAEEWTGLQFCVYLGPADTDPRTAAVALMGELGLAEAPAAVIFVVPETRRLEIVTSEPGARRVSDDAAQLAALAMSASFGVGDVTGGIVEAVRLLAQAAGPGTRTGADLPDVVDRSA